MNFTRVIIVKIRSFVGEWLQSDGTDEAEDAIVDLKKRWRNPDFEWLLTASAMTTAAKPAVDPIPSFGRGVRFPSPAP